MTSEISARDSEVIGRAGSLFADDLREAGERLRTLVGGSSLLLLGGAGSIGAQTLRTLLRYGPRTVHVIDHNENGLAELTRSLRSSTEPLPSDELLMLPFDIGGDPFRLWLASNQTPYDFVLNFAALKHVRSEKDPYSVLAMLETNVVHLDRLSELFSSRTSIQRVFSVSTDKAANPSSMMGATKRLMEHALFGPSTPWSAVTGVTSARFANVAFSNGSLLQAWERRLREGQPLSCPSDCRRYFISLEESGELCALAGLLGSHGTISMPTLDPTEHLILLADVAARFLSSEGFQAVPMTDPDEAKSSIDSLRRAGKYPLLLTPLDTSGEKPYEEFVGEDELTRPGPSSSLLEIPYLPPSDRASFGRLVQSVKQMLAAASEVPLDTATLRSLIGSVEPAFLSTHRASSELLDDRM